MNSNKYGTQFTYAPKTHGTPFSSNKYVTYNPCSRLKNPGRNPYLGSSDFSFRDAIRMQQESHEL